MDVPGHDADLAFLGSDETGAVGADQAGLVLLHETSLHGDLREREMKKTESNYCGTRLQHFQFPKVFLI